MQSRVVVLDDGKYKDNPILPIKTVQLRALQLLLFFGLFVSLCIAFSIVSVYMIKHFGVDSVVTTVKSSFQPCFEEVDSLEQYIRTPANLMHKMNDEELFWRASFAPRRRKYPFRRVPKIAFMFLTKGPSPLAPLCESFFKGHEGLYQFMCIRCLLLSLNSLAPMFSVEGKSQVRSTSALVKTSFEILSQKTGMIWHLYGLPTHRLKI